MGESTGLTWCPSVVEVTGTGDQAPSTCPTEVITSPTTPMPGGPRFHSSRKPKKYPALQGLPSVTPFWVLRASGAPSALSRLLQLLKEGKNAKEKKTHIESRRTRVATTRQSCIAGGAASRGPGVAPSHRPTVSPNRLGRPSIACRLVENGSS